MQREKWNLFAHYRFLQCLLMVISWHSSLTFGQPLLEGDMKPLLCCQPVILPWALAEPHCCSADGTSFLTLGEAGAAPWHSAPVTVWAQLHSPLPLNAPCREPLGAVLSNVAATCLPSSLLHTLWTAGQKTGLNPKSLSL